MVLISTTFKYLFYIQINMTLGELIGNWFVLLFLYNTRER